MRWSKPVQVITVVLALGAAMGGAPADARPAPENCVESDAAGRGGPREPGLDQVHEDLPAAAKGKAAKTFHQTVPVWIHVITDGPTGALTSPQIADQIAVLNNTFAGGEGGARTGFSFRLAGVTRTDNAAWFYANPGGTNENSMKRTLRRGGPETLNFYSTTAGDYLGWAYLPDIVTKPGKAYLDGVVIDWESIPGTSSTYAGRYDQGETATHEVGHWLNLEHTFYGGCNAKGDFVADTPAEKEPTSGCPAGKDTCTAPGLDPIHNYMDYSYDSCYTQFTPGQAQRMADAALLYRPVG
ncbi:pregnancy-associated plasma protein-A [Kribbella amoyensis]|uniref:Pregnancy-associated plasma protein-A n=1 Tax=Kribbella amoyensis TaxID=996641 RepID=A0A561BQX5_9ACTN|nr:zinc metalloprotease [Kribbella amoyensis]TWD81288.1 pregnancy-associated plasma protein-A [Kribbella amoyensis]